MPERAAAACVAGTGRADGVAARGAAATESGANAVSVASGFSFKNAGDSRRGLPIGAFAVVRGGAVLGAGGDAVGGRTPELADASIVADRGWGLGDGGAGVEALRAGPASQFGGVTVRGVVAVTLACRFDALACAARSAASRSGRLASHAASSRRACSKIASQRASKPSFQRWNFACHFRAASSLASCSAVAFRSATTRAFSCFRATRLRWAPSASAFFAERSIHRRKFRSFWFLSLVPTWPRNVSASARPWSSDAATSSGVISRSRPSSSGS